jgi:hypothetical protein
MRISLDSASRDELVNFVKKQAIAVKKRDEKISGTASHSILLPLP